MICFSRFPLEKREIVTFDKLQPRKILQSVIFKTLENDGNKSHKQREQNGQKL